MKSLSTKAIGLLLFAAFSSAAIADWPQFGGVNRDFEVAANHLAADWPASGLERVWEWPLGEGYSTPIVVGKRVFANGRQGDEEIVVSLDRADGTVVWEHRYPSKEPPGKLDKQFGRGPRSTPLHVSGRLFTIDIAGRLVCLDAEKGKEIWSVELVREMGGNLPFWGYSSSPLALGEHLIVPVGGNGQALVAFRQSDGEVIWKSGSTKNAYSSPVLIEVGGQPQIVAFMSDGVHGLDAASGESLWQHPHTTDYDVNATMPVWGEDNLLFLGSAYNSGSRMLRLSRSGDKTTVEEVWKNRKLNVHHGDVIRVGNTLYMPVGMMGVTMIVAVDTSDGKIKWRERVSKATFVRSGERSLVLGEDGSLILARMNRSGFAELSRMDELLKPKAWAAPAVDGGQVLLRDRERLLVLALP